jgi:hypothetical protein
MVTFIEQVLYKLLVFVTFQSVAVFARVLEVLRDLSVKPTGAQPWVATECLVDKYMCIGAWKIDEAAQLARRGFEQLYECRQLDLYIKSMSTRYLLANWST